MPLDFGVSELIGTEYRRFLEGLADLSDGGQRAARAAAARVRRGETATRTISVPGWDDVVHVQPRPTITPAMREAHYAARRNNQPSPLSGELQQEIQRRADRARSMRSSAAPEYARAYGQVMTALDNVQDLLTTVTTVGRVALAGGARLLDAMGPAALATAAERAALAEAEAAGFLARSALARRAGLGLGARTIGRLIPILGPILLAADVLKLITWLGLLMFPGYAAACAGLSAAAAAGALPAAQAMLGKRAGKQRLGQLGKLNPWSMTARLDRARTLRSWRPSIYNLMEVAQTTDQLFGVGVSFGGLVGLVTESAFSTEAGRRGLPVRVDASGAGASIHRLLAPRLQATSTPELTDLQTAGAVLAHGPVLQRVQEVFSFAEHVDALVAQAAAWSILRPWIELEQFPDALAFGLDHWWAPPAPRWLETRAIVIAETGEWDGQGRWPLLGAPERVQGERYMQDTATEIPGALLALVRGVDETPGAGFAAAVAVLIADRAAILMTGATDAVRLRWTPDWALAEGLALAGRVPLASEDEHKLMAFWTSALGEMQRQGRQQLPAETYDQLATEAGIHLLRA